MRAVIITEPSHRLRPPMQAPTARDAGMRGRAGFEISPTRCLRYGQLPDPHPPITRGACGALCSAASVGAQGSLL